MRRTLTAFLAASAHAAFVPDFALKPDDRTVLMAVDAKLAPGLTPFQPGSHGKFHIQGWQHPSQSASWTVNSAEPADHQVDVLIRRIHGTELTLEVSAASQTLTGTLPAHAVHWQRITLPGKITVPAGESNVTLRITPANNPNASFAAEVHALEWTRPAVHAAQNQRAIAQRADPTWFQNARYGIMVHWTSQSMPRHGDPLPYDQAVANFDVDAFANQMHQTGAGFVVFTTSHAFQYFPAPLNSLDQVLPGRTSKRDLVADLAAALAARHMRLMLYYHLGAHDDTAWTHASGFWETDTSRFFTHWQNIITEVGERYRERLAGWWFDDGSTNYYYRSPPWEKLNAAAKAGHPQRLVGFNAWELNNPTPFHDFFTGEGFQDARGFNGLLVRGGNGRYPSGTHQGLQASACLITEASWLHHRKNQPLNPPKWSDTELAAILTEFSAHRNVPIFNLEITQEGTVSPASVEMIRNAAQLATPPIP